MPGTPDFEQTVALDPPEAEPADDVVFDARPADEDRPLDVQPTIGHIGRYALKYRLGEGGLGTVYAAFDPLLSRPVALKTLPAGEPGAEREAFEAMLVHEARAAAALSHPYIVTVYDAGPSDDGVYLAMERLQGRDLRRLLDEGWRPNVRQAAQIVRRVAEAISYAHQHGVIHCDLKPSNIFMTGRTSPKVLDFGIARVAQQPAAGGTLGGSPYYMAPEQLRGDALDRRVDVYALGVVLYELLTGRRAYAGKSLEEIADAVRYRTPPPAHEVNRDVPKALSAIVARAMAKDPADRHRSARLLARELRDWVDAAATDPEPGPWRAVGVSLATLVVAGLAWAWWPGAQPTADAATAAVATVAPMAVGASASAVPEASAASASAASAAAASAADTTVADAGAAGASTPALVVAAAPVETTTATTPASPKPPRAVRKAPPRGAPGAAPAAQSVAAPATGVVQLAVSPWGQVEVDGAAMGTTPPLNRLTLTAGRHTIVIRNTDFPPHTSTVEVDAERPVAVRHRFGP